MSASERVSHLEKSGLVFTKGKPHFNMKKPKINRKKISMHIHGMIYGHRNGKWVAIQN